MSAPLQSQLAEPDEAPPARSGSDPRRACDVAHMLSREGSHQGCPMGTTVGGITSLAVLCLVLSTPIYLRTDSYSCCTHSFLFILTVAEAVEQIAEQYPSVTILGIADDYRFVGPTQDTLDAVEAYSAAIDRLGGVFQTEKSWLPPHGLLSTWCGCTTAGR